MLKSIGQYLGKNWIAILALLVAAFPIFYSIFFQDPKIDELKSRYDAIQFHPQISLSDTPTISMVAFKSKEYKERPKFVTPPIHIPEIPYQSMSVEGTITLQITLPLINRGNSKADLMGWIIYDSVYGGELLREIMLNKSKATSRLNATEDSSFYRCEEILPGDTLNKTITFPLFHPQKDMFTVHILLLYENELGNLFDSYFWLKGSIGEIFILVPSNVKVNNQQNIYDPKSKRDNYFKVNDYNISTNSYTKDQKEMILDDNLSNYGENF